MKIRASLVWIAAVVTAVSGLVSVPAAAQPVAGKTAALRGGSVVIKRDTYGVPNIYAKDAFGLFYGYGYAAAQDRLFQLEMTKRAAEGTVAAVLGGSYAAFDTRIRSTYDPGSIKAQITGLAGRDRQILDGYTAGVNAWVDKVMTRPGALLPKEYTDFGFRPSRWTDFDVAMITVGTMDLRFSDFNAELANLNTLTALIRRYGAVRGQQLFDQLDWTVDPLAPSTISTLDQAGGSAPGSTTPPAIAASRSMPNHLVRPTTSPARAPTATPPAARTAAAHEVNGLLAAVAPAAPPTFSNMMLVGKGRAAGASALMLNGPQFGWFNPSYDYSVGLHGAGFDVVGNTPFAYPVVLFGHNRDISWGATAGNGDTVDIYQEHLDPADPHRYLYRGRYLPMSARTVTIDVKGGTPQTTTIYSTVHGTVTSFDVADGVAYSEKRTWAGKELQVLFAWLHSTQARNWHQWLGRAAQLPISINWYYADRRGNIGYAFCGSFPIRPADQDRRLPADGTGSMEWRGFQPFATANPHILNPVEGYLANWNNSPAPAYPNSDFIPWGRADRVQLLQRALAAQTTVDARQLWNIMRRAALEDINVGYFRPFIAQAVRGLATDSPEQVVYRALARWDGLSVRGSDDRYTEPGTAIMQTWLTNMFSLTLQQVLPASVYAAFSDPGYPTRSAPYITHSKNISAASKVLYNALLGPTASVPQTFDIFSGRAPNAVIRDALRRTAEQLTGQFGPNPASWRPLVAQNVFGAQSYLGIPATIPAEQLVQPLFLNRGTENDLMVLGTTRIAGYEVVPPGESGFIAPDGTKSPHYQDQLAEYTNFRYHRTWFTRAEVNAHLESVTVLSYRP